MNFLYNDNDEMIMIQPSMKWKWKIKKWVLYFRLGTQTYSLLLYYSIYMVKRGFSSTFFICSRIQESKVYLSVCLFVCFKSRVNHRNYFYFYLSLFFLSLKFILLSSILIFSSLLKRLKTEWLNNINKKTTLLYL